MHMPSEQSVTGHVLVADDEADICELFAEFIREQGFTVATVQDGRAAVAELGRAPGLYQIVFTDLSMPGADGFEVLRAARAANPSVYVVIVTGYASIDTAIQAVRDGANDYLAKPSSLKQIGLVLQRADEHLKLNRSNEVIDRLTAVEQRLSLIEAGLDRLDQHLRILLPQV
jgi:two-component system, NtrC family, response regulator HydG